MYETRSQRLLWRPNGGGFRAGSHGGEYVPCRPNLQPKLPGLSFFLETAVKI